VEGLTEFERIGIRCAADILSSSNKTVVLSGAGLSTSSGIPDFRSTNDGLWELYDPFEVASLISFRQDPSKFYNWMHTIALKIHLAQPNQAHLGIAHLQRAGYIHHVITQNIDALHQRAGSNNVLEVHGSMEKLTCLSCYQKFDAKPYIQPYLDSREIPICPSCGSYLKPDLILFGEQLPAKVWLKAVELSKSCDLMLVVGSSLEVLPVASLPMRVVERGAHLIIINHSPTYLDARADFVFHDGVEMIIPRIAAKLIGE